MKPFTTLTCLLLAVIAVVQLTRALMGWDIVINGYAVPLWASAIASIVTGVLAAMTWRETHR